MSRWGSAIGARLIRASMLADRAYTRFDRLRSLLITSFASDGTLEAYNDIAYGATSVYDASAPQFRTRLFNWEIELVDLAFPKPPARVLVGGAGGGREAFELASRGYQVSAFEPSLVLARSMSEKSAQGGGAVDVFLGRYEDLPRLRRFPSDETVDFTHEPRFDVSLLGWSSYSHIRHRQDRIETLRRFAMITDGPVIASFFMRPPASGRVHPVVRLSTRLGFRTEGDSFTPYIGYYHLSSEAELAAEVADAGLTIVDASYNGSEGYWPWIAVARPEIAAALSARVR